MTLRQPHDDAVLPAGDAARIRQALAACSRLLAWAQEHRGRRGGRGRRPGPPPGVLACEVSLAIDCLDFAPAARSTR